MGFQRLSDARRTGGHLPLCMTLCRESKNAAAKGERVLSRNLLIMSHPQPVDDIALQAAIASAISTATAHVESKQHAVKADPAHDIPRFTQPSALVDGVAILDGHSLTPEMLVDIGYIHEIKIGLSAEVHIILFLFSFVLPLCVVENLVARRISESFQVISACSTIFPIAISGLGSCKARPSCC